MKKEEEHQSSTYSYYYHHLVHHLLHDDDVSLSLSLGVMVFRNLMIIVFGGSRRGVLQIKTLGLVIGQLGRWLSTSNVVFFVSMCFKDTSQNAQCMCTFSCFSIHVMVDGWMNRGDRQLHAEYMFALVEWILLVCCTLLLLVGMLPEEHAVAWRPFSPYFSLYLNTSDDECMNE